MCIFWHKLFKFTADLCETCHLYFVPVSFFLQVFAHCFEPCVCVTENVPVMQIGAKLISFEGLELGLFSESQIHSSGVYGKRTISVLAIIFESLSHLSLKYTECISLVCLRLWSFCLKSEEWICSLISSHSAVYKCNHAIMTAGKMWVRPTPEKMMSGKDSLNLLLPRRFKKCLLFTISMKRLYCRKPWKLFITSNRREARD